MKKIIFSLLIIVALSIYAVSKAVAISPTPSKAATPLSTRRSTPSPTATREDKQIEKIKDLVASKVAELKLVDKRGMVGKVKTSSDSQITATDFSGKEIKVDVDELTKFNSSDKDSFGISDVKNGDVLSIIGLFNKDTERLLARFISYATNIPENVEAVVTDKDAANFSLTIATTDGRKMTVDIESSTKTESYEDGDTIKSGFSKIEKVS